MPPYSPFPSSDAVRAVLAFGGAFLALNVLPYIPTLLTPLPLSPYFPLCIEVLVLATGVVYAVGTPLERPVRIGALTALALVVGYQTYDAVVYTAFQRSALAYEDIRFVDNLAYFASDVATWRLVGWGSAGLLGAVGLAGGAAYCVRLLGRVGRTRGARVLLWAAHLVAWPLVLVVGPLQEWGVENLTYQSSKERARVRTVTTKAWANAQASVRLARMMDSLDTASSPSPYAAYDTLSLDRPPSVYLIAVESYGTLLEQHPDLRAPYRSLLEHTEVVLTQDGWHAATARANAPVRGGRSWLAIASLLTGVEVDRQALYTRFQKNPNKTPHLVRFLNRQGYHTVALQPLTFERPGLPTRNLYDFDVTLYRDDLSYRGPSFGLADAPDQYSLNYAHQNQLAGTEPFFLFFETVDSHALWNYGLPPVLSDWTRFNEVNGPPSKKRERLAQEGQPPGSFLPDSITAPSIYDQPRSLRYLRHIAYDLQVLRRYLIEAAPEGSLVLLLGDHQPPLFNTKSAAVPLHVLSTDSTLVDRVRRRGFTKGLVPARSSPTLEQESLYSLLVRLLAERNVAGPNNPPRLPPVQSEGAAPSTLLPSATEP